MDSYAENFPFDEVIMNTDENKTLATICKLFPPLYMKTYIYVQFDMDMFRDVDFFWYINNLKKCNTSILKYQYDIHG